MSFIRNLVISFLLTLVCGSTLISQQGYLDKYENWFDDEIIGLGFGVGIEYGLLYGARASISLHDFTVFAGTGYIPTSRNADNADQTWTAGLKYRLNFLSQSRGFRPYVLATYGSNGFVRPFFDVYENMSFGAGLDLQLTNRFYTSLGIYRVIPPDVENSRTVFATIGLNYILVRNKTAPKDLEAAN